MALRFRQRQSAMKFNIMVHNVGRTPQRVIVVDADGRTKRPAVFNSWASVLEACLIVESLRQDSAFNGCHPIGQDGNPA